MNNFEKRLFLDYLDKLSNEIKYDDYDFRGIFDFFIKEFKVKEKIFKARNFIEDYENGRSRRLVNKLKEIIDTTDLNNSKSFDKFKVIFKNTVKELKEKIPVKKTSLENKLLLLKNIFQLNDLEYNIMTYFAIQEINNIFKCLFEECLKGRERLETFAQYYCGIRVSQLSRIVKNLALKSILIDKSIRKYIEINSRILRVLDDKNCKTEKQIINILLGEPQKSTLKANDYKHIEKERIKAVTIIKSAVEQKRKGINILLYGNVGTGKTEFAKLIANMSNIPMYAVTKETDNYEEADRNDRLIDFHTKQEILKRTDKSCILFDEAEDVMNRGFSIFGHASKGYMNKILEENPIPVIWTTNNISDVDSAFLRRMTYAIEFENLSEETRLNIWNKILKKNNFKVPKSKIEELNKSYDISPSIIANAIQTTQMTGGDENDFEGYIENITKIVQKKKNIRNTKTFKSENYDVNLVNTDLDVDDLADKIKSCGKLNFSICMYGEPGTGKSEYSRYLANKLNIEIIQKRASDLMSKYVGQTEQNIAAAFNEAKEKKAMLIFDEADSFLQNRNNAVRNWEVSQVNEMLTWMESHEYPFICTTNLLDTLDEASLRRFTFKIKFDFMTNNQTNLAMKHFFKIDNANLNIKGLTTGDFATVKKKADFLNITDVDELAKMLQDEVKLKQSKELKNAIGF